MAELHIVDATTWRVRGELSFAGVPALLRYIETQAQLPQVLDLAEVSHSDSAGLALLVELLARSRQLRLHNLPAQLAGLAEVHGLRQLLAA